MMPSASVYSSTCFASSGVEMSPYATTGRLGHHGRVGTRDLHRDRFDLAVVVCPAERFLAAPEKRVRRHHLGYRQTRAEFFAQLPERAVGDAGHRRDEQIIAQRVRTDSHRRSRKILSSGSAILYRKPNDKGSAFTASFKKFRRRGDFFFPQRGNGA